MALIAQPNTHTDALPLGLRIPRPSRRLTMIGFGAIFIVLLADALFNARAFFDLPLLKAIQRVDLPLLDEVLSPIDWAASSEGGIAIWAALMASFLLARWWLPALTMLAIPFGGLVNEAIGMMTNHVRPTADEVARVIGETNAPSFPSGHVAGSVMLYGLLFVVADRIGFRPFRLGVKAIALTIIATIGFDRLWYGAHWPSDVIAAYLLGGLFLIPLVATYRRLDAAVGRLPFIRAAVAEHDESMPHAHALTSLVLFDETTVSKVYAPGFAPRAIYWLAFQAEFPYLRNVAALRAAQHRRNLAALLTEYWYGSSRVARVTSIDARTGGYAVTSERVDGHEPADRAAAKSWLRGLRDHFEEAGLPTWQIDPRQPRAVDNVLETDDGRYMIVDLESGLVAPIASLKTWQRAIRRGSVPMFDDVFFDITRDYVAREEPAIRAVLGDERTDELLATLDAAEATAIEWHRSEPRIWSRAVRSLMQERRVRRTWGWVQARLEGSQDKARAWLAGAIDTWEAEGRATADEAATMRSHMNSADFQMMLPHLGAHLVISIVLRFPFGSIARAAWSAGALLTATVRLLARRIDRRAWKQAWSIHSPLVIVLSAIPGIGSFAYLTAKPVRSNRLLFRAAGDVALRKLPWRLYDRSHLARFIARPAGAVAVAESAPQPASTVLPEPAPVVALTSVEPAETPRRVIPFRSIPGRRGDDGSLPRTRTGPSVGDPAQLPAA
jgi:undecaprenyl-diphosphatase